MAVLVCGCGVPMPALDVPAADATDVVSADAVDSTACTPCGDPCCRGCSAGCCLVFEDGSACRTLDAMPEAARPDTPAELPDDVPCTPACFFFERCDRGRCVPRDLDASSTDSGDASAVDGRVDVSPCDALGTSYRPCGSAGECVDTATSLMHCGACGSPCSSVIVGGTAECRAGTCSPTCSSGRADCDRTVLNGCEVDLNTDRANCGGCGMICPASESCIGGACTCRSTETRCGGVSGTCVDLNTSTAHCGRCFNACGFPGGIASCDVGSCHLDGCLPNFVDCNRNPSDGCEVDLRVRGCP